MKLFTQKLYEFSCKFSQVCSVLLTGALFISAFLCTCYASDMEVQAATLAWDNPLWGALGILAFLPLFYGVWRISSKYSKTCSKWLLVLTLIWSLVVGCSFILWGKTIPAADSMSVFSMAEQLAQGNMGVIHPTDSYISYYPQQIGLIAFYEVLIRLWNLLPLSMQAYPGIQFLNVLLAWVIIYFGHRTVKILWNREQANCLYLLLAAANIPLLMYTSFVYGEIPSFAASSVGMYYFFLFLQQLKRKAPEESKASDDSSTCGKGAWMTSTILPFATSILALSVGVLLRKNSLILIIAVLIVAVFEYLHSHRKLLPVYALLCLVCATSILPLCRSIYEHRSGNTIGSGVTAMSYFAMGMQESSRGMGWYNGFNFNTYRDTGMDSVQTNQQSREAIRARLDYFRQHPAYTAGFYLEKFLSQWTDGSYASRQATYAATANRHPLVTSLYEGDLSRIFLTYCNAYQNLLYGGAFFFFLTTQKRKMPLYQYLGLIGVLGGFLFHTIWEANSRYIFVYGLLLLPYGAKGLDILLQYGHTFLCRVQTKTKAPNSFCRLLLGSILCFTVAIGIWKVGQHTALTLDKQIALEQLETSTYNGVFCSMYPIETYQEEDFTTYRGVTTMKVKCDASHTNDIADYLQTAFASGNSVSNVYLGLDPAEIWADSHKSQDRWAENISLHLEAFITAHPDTTFEILLPYYSQELWMAQSADSLAESMTTFHTLINTLDQHPNTILYFVGMEQWLIANPHNYLSEGNVNETLARKIFLYTFCDHEYQINSENAQEKLSALQNYILSEQSAPTTYAKLDNSDIVFFGDSIIGNYTGSFSVPGVVSALSGARTYNCAKGGTTASRTSDDALSFPASVTYFTTGNLDALPQDSPFPTALTEYMQDTHSRRELIFVINYGLNDYFGGFPAANPDDPYDPATYAGALRTGIAQIRASYPRATILLMAPNFVTYYENGTVPLSESGSILLDYVNAAETVAQECSVLYMDNYHDLGVSAATADALLEDGCHLNEAGRFLLGERIIDFLSKN